MKRPSKSLRVLYVGSYPPLQDAINFILARDEHAVEVAGNAPTGLEVFSAAQQRGEPFDVVIVDWGRSLENGPDVIRTFKRKSPGVCLIVLTGWDSPLSSDATLASDVDAVIRKPDGWNALRLILKKIAQGKQDLRPLPTS